MCCESEYDDTPQNLREVFALFPNTTELRIDWQVSDDGLYELDPTDSGDHLQHLKRLNLVLEADRRGTEYGSLQAGEANMIINHLHMPALESITIDYKISHDGDGYIDDGEAIYGALSGIKSPDLKDVTLRVTMPTWGEEVVDNIPQPWVSKVDSL